jgi:hypothetical protein
MKTFANIKKNVVAVFALLGETNMFRGDALGVVRD